jgi:hypothetical protein
MQVRGAHITAAATAGPIAVSIPLSNAKPRFQGMGDFAPGATRIARYGLNQETARALELELPLALLIQAE